MFGTKFEKIYVMDGAMKAKNKKRVQQKKYIYISCHQTTDDVDFFFAI